MEEKPLQNFRPSSLRLVWDELCVCLFSFYINRTIDAVASFSGSPILFTFSAVTCVYFKSRNFKIHRRLSLKKNSNFQAK